MSYDCSHSAFAGGRVRGRIIQYSRLPVRYESPVLHRPCRKVRNSKQICVWRGQCVWSGCVCVSVVCGGGQCVCGEVCMCECSVCVWGGSQCVCGGGGVSSQCVCVWRRTSCCLNKDNRISIMDSLSTIVQHHSSSHQLKDRLYIKDACSHIREGGLH